MKKLEDILGYLAIASLMVAIGVIFISIWLHIGLFGFKVWLTAIFTFAICLAATGIINESEEEDEEDES